MSDNKLAAVLEQAETGRSLSKVQIRYLLGLTDPKQIKMLFLSAQNVRKARFGTHIFLYGFLYFSTFCRNNCRFCQYRNANTRLDRYRKSREQILAAAKDMARLGVHLIDLTMGEDPELYDPDKDGFDAFSTLVGDVRETTGLPVMVSGGVVSDDVVDTLSYAGAEWFACYQETHNRELYTQLRQGQDFDVRMDRKRRARQQGMLIEEGLLTGVGDSLDDLADSIFFMQDMSVDQARVMTFVPQENTPMAHVIPQGSLKELMTIAVMRLSMPNTLIPASLDVDGLDGLKDRLDAGANVVTSIVPPEKGLAGVAHSTLDIEDSRRNPDHILPILKECGLEPASAEQYRTWVSERRALRDLSGNLKRKQAS